MTMDKIKGYTQCLQGQMHNKELTNILGTTRWKNRKVNVRSAPFLDILKKFSLCQHLKQI